MELSITIVGYSSQWFIIPSSAHKMTLASSRKHFNHEKNCNELANQTKPFHVCKFQVVRSFVCSFSFVREMQWYQICSLFWNAKFCCFSFQFLTCSGNGFAPSVQLSRSLWRQRWQRRWRWLLVFYWLTKLSFCSILYFSGIFMLFALFTGNLSAWCTVHTMQWIPNNLDSIHFNDNTFYSFFLLKQT